VIEAPAEVTPIGPEDEDAVFAMLLELHKENGIFPVAEPKVRDFIKLATEAQGGIIGVIRGETELEASMGMMITQWWYTEEWCLAEQWLYVKSDYRNKPHASHLVDYGKWCAQQLGVPLQTGIISTSRTAAKERMYARKMTPVGSLFIWKNGVTDFKTGTH
jgi:hypothetical protein